MARGFKSVVIPLAILSIPVAAILILGPGFVNLDLLRERTLLFHTVFTVPLAGGVALTALAVLPRVVWINAVLIASFWLVVETVVAISSGQPEFSMGDPEPLVQDSYIQRDARLGYSLVPDNVARHVSTWNGSVEFDVTYEIDGFGRRTTPVDSEEKRERFLIFFGCSNTFGEGVEQRETMPYFAGKRAPEYWPYNYGVHGYGPAQALDLVTTRNFVAEVKEKRGVAVFHFIPAHLWRVVGASNVATTWGRYFSNYELNEAGYPVRHGDFTNGRPLVTLLYELTRQSRVLAALGLVFPLRFHADDFLLTARILVAMRDLLEQQVDLEGFYVTFPPVFTSPQADLTRKMRAVLKTEGIAIIDLTDVFVASDRKFRVAENNYHQSVVANRVLAKSLLNSLGLSGAAVP